MRNKETCFSTEQGVLLLVQKQLDYCNVKLDDVKILNSWYDKFTITSKELEEWYKHGNVFFKKINGYRNASKETITKELNGINFNFGLRVDNNKYKRKVLIEKGGWFQFNKP